MLFSSTTFLFVFLPILCLVYFVARKSMHNTILLIASILFYAWGEPKYLAVLFITVILNYTGSIFLVKYQKHKKIILMLTILANLGILFYFKYFNFVMDNINNIFSSDIAFINVVMPIGISFYTFQSISYLIDVYRGDVKVQKNIYKLLLYICLFPQLIAGPIVKYHDIDKQIDDRDVSFDKVCYGVKRFIMGLSKKMLIANTLGAVADKIFALPVEQFDVLTSWIGAIAYSFQLFYDFSGYSDMAIGLGYIFGFKFLENFNYPYISKSITEFWRRWHISLSTWFKEYLYIHLGGNRISNLRTYINLFIVFLATGIWHGAEWTFVVWGLWHGFFIIFERVTGFHKKEGNKLFYAGKHVYTIIAFIIGWVIFRAPSLKYALDYIRNMFGMISKHDVVYDISYYIGNFEIISFVAAFICCIPVFSKMLDVSNNRKILKFVVSVWLLFLFFTSASMIAVSTYNPFIYFRF